MLVKPLVRPIVRAIAGDPTASLGSGFSPTSLFLDGSKGVLYDNNDLSSFYLDSAGTTAATVNGLVGLQLDKSANLALGSNVVDNFNSLGVGWTWAGGVLEHAAGSSSRASDTTAVVADRWYAFTYTVTASNAGGALSVEAGSLSGVSAPTTVGTHTVYALAGATNTWASFFAASGLAITITDISVKQLAGNHRYQTTTGSKPVLRGTPIGANLVTNGDFASGTGWTLTSGATISGGTLNLDGNGAPGNVLGFQNIGLTTGKTYLVRCSIASVTGSVQVWDNGGTPLASFTTTGAKEFYFTHNNASGNIVFRAAIGANTASIDNVTIYDVSAGSVTAPYGLQYDGVDDFMQTAAVDFTATDKMFVCAGVRKLSDAAFGTLMELSASVSANNGSLALFVPPGAATPGYEIRSKGTVEAATNVVVGYAAPITNVLTGVANIAGPSVALRVNGAQVASNLASQGAGNYGNHVFYFGRRGGASLPYNGLDFGMVICGKTLTSTQIASTERYIAQRTGVVI